MDRLTILRPDDWHLHVRDAQVLSSVVAFSARRFGRAIVMPNLVPPVTTVAEAVAYRERVLAAVPDGVRFDPLMTLYLTEETTTAEVERAAAHEHVAAVKLYPAGATTNSEAGVRSLEPVYGVFEAMAEAGLPLLIHGEDTDPSTDVFDPRPALSIGSKGSPADSVRTSTVCREILSGSRSSAGIGKCPRPFR